MKKYILRIIDILLSVLRCLLLGRSTTKEEYIDENQKGADDNDE